MLDRLRTAGLRKAAIRNFFRHPIRCFAGRLFAPILLLALLAGCGPQPRPSIAGYGTTLYDVPPEQLGLLAGSFGTLKSERRFSGSRLLIRHVSTGQTAAFEFHGGGFLVASDQADFNKSESRGTVFTMKLPAGSYEIYGFGLFQSGGFGGWYGSMREFSVPFAIEPGKVTYVGEYILRRTPGGNVEGVERHRRFDGRLSRIRRSAGARPRHRAPEMAGFRGGARRLRHAGPQPAAPDRRAPRRATARRRSWGSLVAANKSWHRGRGTSSPARCA